MSNKRSMKSIAIILLIIANIAIVIALSISIRNAINKIEVGKEIETQEAQEEFKETSQDENLEEIQIDETQINEEQEEKITLKQIVGQLNNENTSVVEIVLVLIGIALFVLGLILIRVAKKIS